MSRGRRPCRIGTHRNFARNIGRNVRNIWDYVRNPVRIFQVFVVSWEFCRGRRHRIILRNSVRNFARNSWNIVMFVCLFDPRVLSVSNYRGGPGGLLKLE